MIAPNIDAQSSDAQAKRAKAVNCSLRIVESWLPTVPITREVLTLTQPSPMVDLFDALERPGRGDVLGLWASYSRF
jgi:hypothetical protein